MAKKKTAAELRAEVRFLRQHAIGENITKILIALINKGAYVLIFFFVYLSIDSLAGKDTNANIDVKAKGEISLPNSEKNEGVLNIKNLLNTNITPTFLAILFGFAGINYGRKQAKLRKDTIERLQARIQEFEAQHDPDRTSSKLTPRGDTNPEDMQ